MRSRTNVFKNDLAALDAELRRVVEKLELHEEGLARRYLEINGVWEDHIRYAITAEDWERRGPELIASWID